ncbi:hypothetical protein ACMAY9_07800 [Porticoccaceae bacterium nBUS_09]
MAKNPSKNVFKKRSAWIASMVACLAFLLMAVKVYDLPLSTLTSNLLTILVGLSIIVGLAALLGGFLAFIKRRIK